MLWGHALADFRTIDFNQNRIYLAIYSFHMPLFMAIVGFFSESVANMGLRDMILTKARQLLLPPTAFYLPLAIGVCIKSGPDTMITNYITSFWFLKSAFFCFILYFASMGLIHARWVAIIVSWAVSLTISTFAISWMYTFFLFGILLRHNFDYIVKRSGQIAAISGTIFCLTLPFYDTAVLTHGRKFPLTEVLNLPTADFEIFYCYFIGLVTGFSGTVAVISLFKYLSRKISFGKPGEKIARLGSETLAVYLFQTILIELPPKYIGYLNGMNDILYYYIVTPLASLAVVVLTHYTLKPIKRNRLLSLLLLGKRLRMDEQKPTMSFTDVDKSSGL